MLDNVTHNVFHKTNSCRLIYGHYIRKGVKKLPNYRNRHPHLDIGPDKDGISGKTNLCNDATITVRDVK